GDVRRLLLNGSASPDLVRAAVASVSPADRDAWWDTTYGVDGIPNDGPDLPRGCVPYLPCSVATLVEMVEQADVRSDDVFVDIGSGLGRATALTHCLTGASAI